MSWSTDSPAVNNIKRKIAGTENKPLAIWFQLWKILAMTVHLKDWRVSAGKKLDEVAAETGISVPTWSRWETGARQIPPERVPEVERITGISRHVLRPDIFGPAPEVAAE